MLFITLGSRDKTCSKIEKPWLRLVQWAGKSGKMSGKMITILIYSRINNLFNLFLFIYLIDHRLQQFRYIRHDQWLILPYYSHQRVIQKKLETFKKCNFSGQTLDFLPPRKPGLYTSRVDFFFFEYCEYPVECINTVINCRF